MQYASFDSALPSHSRMPSKRIQGNPLSLRSLDRFQPRVPNSTIAVPSLVCMNYGENGYWYCNSIAIQSRKLWHFVSGTRLGTVTGEDELLSKQDVPVVLVSQIRVDTFNTKG